MARSSSISASWSSQSLQIRLLRAFLGITWIYAGWNKVSDPTFLTKGGRNYIGNQIAAFVPNSPIGFLLNHGAEHPILAGWLTIIGELMIGIGTLLFIAPRFFAFAGFVSSVGLFLSVTFHVRPYFLGSDSAYAVMWLVYLITLMNNGRRKIGIDMNRRSFLRSGSVFGITAGIAAIGQLFPSRASKAVAASKTLIPLSKLPIGATHPFTSANGQPAMLFRTKAGVFAYSLICTHQGCTVGYNAGAKALQCPCHGATYDPFKGAKVTAGPAPAPLAKIKVKISGKNVVEA